MLIHTGCTLVSPLPVIFPGGDVQRNGYSCLPLRPPQMSLGLPFNQCRLYPHMNFGLAAQSWHDNLPTRSFTVVLLSPLGFPARLAVDHRLETSCLPLARRIYSAPYGRTNDVVVDMLLVNVSADDESVFPFGQRFGEVIADPVRCLRVDLAGLERLAKVIGDHIIFSRLPSRELGVLPLGKQKLLIGDGRIALIGRNQMTAIGLFGVLHIVHCAAQRLGNAAALACVQGHQSRGRHGASPELGKLFQNVAEAFIGFHHRCL